MFVDKNSCKNCTHFLVMVMVIDLVCKCSVETIRFKGKYMSKFSCWIIIKYLRKIFPKTSDPLIHPGRHTFKIFRTY